MKKIVVVLIVFVANIVSVDAMKLEVRKEDEVDEFDKWLIANLANPYDEMKNNVIQKMILEYVNPNYGIQQVKEDDSQCDLSEEVRKKFE